MSSPNASTNGASRKGCLPLPERRDFTYAPSTAPLTIIYQDDDLLVVDKPAGLLSVPGRQLPDNLQTRLKVLHPESLLVHRLDMATSGVMVFARNKPAQRHLGLQFERRHTSKSYIARVSGKVDGESGRINLPLIADWPNRPRQMVSWEHGKPSVTDWEVLGREANETRLALHPVTGRSHQLRVHCWAMGHPILGDRIYAMDDVFEAASGLQLHALKLGLRHPKDGTPISFESPCPF
jgi:tRNA pseudouridine32 synthase/23S rRNA pseudouridine746 synthase